MYKALARAAPLKPELRLVQAISEFEMKLSTQQKNEIQKHSRAPDMDDIMRLTAEIDRASSAKATERRRCYGPRVTSFLEGLHQFAGTVDIAVGGAIQKSHSIRCVGCSALLITCKYNQAVPSSELTCTRH